MTETVENFRLRDFRGDKNGPGDKTVKSPTVHVARGYERNIPILACGRPIICISDWQCETPTQRYFWTQAWKILKQQVGGKLLQRALVIVAGDMASSDNTLRGAKSDAAPDYSWLQESFQLGDILIVYGNHDFMSREHLKMKNQASGLPCLLPHGAWLGVPSKGTQYNLVSEPDIDAILEDSYTVDQIRRPKFSQQSHIPQFLQHMTKEERRAYYAKQSFPQKAKASQKRVAGGLQWDRDHPDQAHLAACFRQVQSLVQNNVAKLEEERESSGVPAPLIRIGAVHGIPASHNEGIKKVERDEYFRVLGRVCDPSMSPIDVLVTHYQSCLPGQEEFVRGDDPKRMYEAFLQSQAFMHVCGHMHLDPPVSIVSEGKVVVNVDCRVVAFVPPCFED